MLARILGFIDINQFISPAELETAFNLNYHNPYSAFVFGTWANCILWNKTGAGDDYDLREYEGAGQPTENMARLPGISSLVRSCFKTERLKWLRLFRQESGVVLPHVDFVEMGEGFERIHIPLITAPGALHSEEDQVYHMRPGEIWRVEARRVHSVCNLSGQVRLSLCGDFAPGGPPDSYIHQSVREAATQLEPEVIPRPTFSSDDRQALDDNLTVLLREGRWQDVLVRLISVHFEKNVSSSAMFEWLDDLAAQSHDPEVIERANGIRKLALGA